MQLYARQTVSFDVNNLDDRELVAKILHGDSRVFAVVIRNTERLVTQIVYRMISVPGDRKDIAQDIYLKAFHKLNGFKFQCKLSTWIGQIAYNTCLKYLEKKRLVYLEDYEMAAEAPGAGQPGPEPLLEQKELSGILQKAVGGLQPLYRTLITLFHTEELSYEEIAFITGLPQGTLKSYLFRARKLLKDELLSKYQRDEL